MAAAAPRSADLHVLQVGPLYVNHLRRWSERAAALGCTVTVAGHIRRGRRAAELGEAPERIIVAPGDLWELGFARRAKWLKGVMDEVRPDLVQAHWLPSWGYLAGHAVRVPLILTPWGSDVYLASGLDRRRADRALLRADAVIARSPHMEREIISRGVDPARVYRVDPGVDTELFRPASVTEREALRRELGLGDGPIVLSFRAGTSLYNLDAVIEAFVSVRGRFPEASLVLLTGDAPLHHGLRRSIAASGAADSVLVLSVPHPRVAAYMRAATVGVSIPSSDGSPNSVWEALACGLPLVLSDLPQVREVVGDGGPARFVEPRARPLAESLGEILSGPAVRERMSVAGRDWALRNADPRRGVDQLGRLYKQAMDGAGALTGPTARSGPSPAAAPPSSPS